jgi:hypothetical protein
LTSSNGQVINMKKNKFFLPFFSQKNSNFIDFFNSFLKFILEVQKTWCVAKPSSDQATLLANINFACSQVDCRILQRGCPCYSPDNLINHASVAMNLYYQSKGRNHWNCDFRGSALIAVTDPSKTGPEIFVNRFN